MMLLWAQKPRLPIDQTSCLIGITNQKKVVLKADNIFWNELRGYIKASTMQNKAYLELSVSEYTPL